MAQRPQGVQSKSLANTGVVDTILKAAPGQLYSINIAWSGGTVGDLIHVHDSATADPTADKIFTFRVPTTAGSFPAVLPAVGKLATKGMWLNVQTAGSYSIDVGFD